MGDEMYPTQRKEESGKYIPNSVRKNYDQEKEERRTKEESSEGKK